MNKCTPLSLFHSYVTPMGMGISHGDEAISVVDLNIFRESERDVIIEQPVKPWPNDYTFLYMSFSSLVSSLFYLR